ncbi:hypothetical protein EIN_328890 [Entamoeba invadens IP1]|uniref:Importin N-terminal domain-containing protein n=1 Tax=Entamoeba invadens IP1 TaxID=370355 RepID=A0A0A1TXR5_ENTIV|nr:hypothetical protein EIN_328890 [Entamoeba invadens IP1]ELP86182.1 hypothetical protein EIN_328890 [Entamoeba invadens IP1]|eukprot:XP_004185528.1 hypothetical protein EIN_328890 [Entamoeba invadens IP1]
MSAESLLLQLLSPDNTLRNQAEQLYFSMYNNPVTVIQFHLQSFTSSNVDVKVLSANLLSKNMYRTTTPLYQFLSDDQKNQLRSQLLVYLTTNAPRRLLVAYSNLIYDLFVIDNEYPNLYQTLDALLNYKTEEHRSIALFTIASLVLFGEVPVEFVTHAIEVAIKHTTDVPSVVESSLELYYSLASVAEDHGKEMLRVTVSQYPIFLNSAVRVIQTDRSYAQSVIEKISKLNEETALFIDFIELTAKFAFEALKLPSTDAITAMTLLSELGETYQTLGTFEVPLVEVLFQWMSSLSDTQEWYMCQVEDDSRCFAAQESFQKLSEYIGMANVSNIITRIFGNRSLMGWQNVRACVFMAKVLIKRTRNKEGVQALFDLFLGVCMIHPRVTHELVLFIEVAIHIDKTFLKSNEMKVCQLIGECTKSKIPKLQSSGCDFLAVYIINSPKSNIKTQMENILEMIKPLLVSPQPQVLSSAICSVSFLINQVGKAFQPHFMDFLNGYFDLLKKLPISADYFDLRGRIIESLSVIASYMDLSSVPTFTEQLLSQLNTSIQLPNLKISDGLFGYVEMIIVRLMIALKTQLYPFLDTYFPILLSRCKLSLPPTSTHGGLADEKESAFNCLSVIVNEAFPVCLPRVQDILDIVVTTSYSIDKHFAAIAVEICGSFYINYSSQITTTDNIAGERLIAVFGRGCKNPESDLCIASVNSLERIISHEVPLSGAVVMGNIATVVSQIERFQRRMSEVLSSVTAALSTAICLGNMFPDFLHYVFPIVKEKFLGGIEGKVASLRIIKIAIRDGSLKVNGLLETLKDTELAVREAGMSALIASCERGFENMDLVGTVLWEIARQEQNDYLRAKAIRGIGKLILLSKNRQLGTQWFQLLPPKVGVAKTGKILIDLIYEGLLNIADSGMMQICIFMIAKNLSERAQISETLNKAKTVLVALANGFQNDFKTVVERLDPIQRENVLSFFI